MRFDASTLVACGLLLMVATAAAQPQDFVEARLRLVSTTTPLVGLGFLNGKKAEGLVIPTDMFSAEVIYRGPARLQLIELTTSVSPGEVPPKDDDEKPTPKSPTRGVKGRDQVLAFKPIEGRPPVAWIDLPTNQGTLQLILLVTPGKNNGILALPDASGSFPPGSNRYLNLCAFPLIVRTPAGPQVVPPGGSKVFRPGAKETEYYDLQVLSGEGESQRPLFSGRVFHLESVRKLYLLLPLGSSGRVAVRDIVDRPPGPRKTPGVSTKGPPGGK
jgi:hypothetical protein